MDYVQPIDCMAIVIYREARGESELGQHAVGYVVKNRKDHPKFPDTICKVVFQKCQFSWVCQMDDYSHRKGKLWGKSKVVARQILDGTVENPVPNAVFFKGLHSRKWRYPFIKKIGGHNFYAYPTKK